jgi:ATP-dependent DNA helicase RecQ
VDADELLLVRKVLSGVARGGERWGRRKIAAMLAGDLEDLPDSLTSLSTTGLLRELGARRVERWLDTALAAGLLRASEDEYRTLSLTKDGREVMAGRSAAVTLTPPDADPARRPKEKTRRASSARLVEEPSEPDPRADRVLLRLKEWRRAEASTRGIPAYTVFHDTTLASLAALRPRSLDALARVSGVGPAKLERYGSSLLEILAKEA